jgi:hypothetical protein
MKRRPVVQKLPNQPTHDLGCANTTAGPLHLRLSQVLQCLQVAIIEVQRRSFHRHIHAPLVLLYYKGNNKVKYRLNLIEV